MRKKKVLVTGTSGLVGSAICEIILTDKNLRAIEIAHSQHDLTDERQVHRLFARVKPDYVIHAAARVGGIGRNLSSPAAQFRDNILMNTHMIHHAAMTGVKRLIAFSSICAFPKDLLLLNESVLHMGEPFDAHRSYAYAKRMVDIQIEAYQKQHGVNYCSLIPGNIFGENDNFDLENGHVIPSLIHKCQIAIEHGADFCVWGDGSPRREFIYARDLARICVDLLKDNRDLPPRMLVSGEEFTIKEIANIVKEAMGYDKEIVWQTDKPNGQLKRPTDQSQLLARFPDFKRTDIREALQTTRQWFKQNYPNVRM